MKRAQKLLHIPITLSEKHKDGRKRKLGQRVVAARWDLDIVKRN